MHRYKLHVRVLDDDMGTEQWAIKPIKSRKSRSADDNKRDPVAYVDVAMNDAVEK